MRVSKSSEDDPFCDLGPVNARRSCQGDVGRSVDWGLGEMVCAGRQDMDEFCIIQSLSSTQNCSWQGHTEFGAVLR